MPSLNDTQRKLLDAAKQIVQTDGISALSTRIVAQSAAVPLSQIHYHFGNRSGLILALLKRENAELLERQASLYDSEIPLSEMWRQACDYLDEDIRSGYVRILHEMISVGFSDDEIADEMRAQLAAWHRLLTEVCAKADATAQSLDPFTPEEFAMLVGQCFLGLETMLLLGMEEARTHGIAGLKKFGDLIEQEERRQRHV